MLSLLPIPLFAALLAEPASPSPAAACTGALTRDSVVDCSLAGHPGVRVAELEREAAAGRKLGARTLLPSNPQVEITAAHRNALWSGGRDRDTNVYGRLSQELEIGGQRRKRMAVADAQIAQADRRIDLIRRDLAAAALTAYYELLAAQEQRAMIGRIARSTETLIELARTSETAGLGSGLTADVAATAGVRVQRQQVEADRRIATARAALAGLLGRDPVGAAVDVQGDLSPLPISDDLAALVAAALVGRAEIELAKAERETLLRQVEMYRRLRVPNPSVVLYAQRDGFNERVLGGGLAFPIVLPSPLGRTYAGEIAEHRALARRAEAEIARFQRLVRTEVSVGYQDFKARQAELALFEPDRLQRAEGHLAALGEEMVAGRISIREAVVLQQSFLEYLGAHIEARRALALASVELARVSGRLPKVGNP